MILKLRQQKKGLVIKMQSLQKIIKHVFTCHEGYIDHIDTDYTRL